MKRLAPVCLSLALLPAALSPPSHASGLRQTHPAKAAPYPINHGIGSGIYSEYPWFTYDGKLMFWTEEDPIGSPQELYMVYIKNRDAVANKPEGTGMNLPNLQLGPDYELDEVNHWVRDHWIEPVGEPKVELRSLAICHRQGLELPLNQPANNRWRYRFSIFFAARAPGTPGNPAPPGTLWRAHNLIVDVDQSTYAITVSQDPTSFVESVPVAPHGANPSLVANEAEPAFSRDSRYFFWGSNAWGGTGNEAHYLGPYSQCDHLMQAPKAYSTLPTTGSGSASYFLWKDQYAQTSRTNYHTLIQKTNGSSALIFEECHGQIPNSTRDTWCNNNNERLSTTGFAGGGQPSNIADSGWWPKGQRIHGNPSTRATHPAVSGGQAADGSWLFFFMRGKQIYYTKLKEN